MNISRIRTTDSGEGEYTDLFEAIAQNIAQKGYSIHHNAMHPAPAESLLLNVQNMEETQFKAAGVGRENKYTVNSFVRTDEVCWIMGETDVEQDWLEWAGTLQRFLNRRLFLGLFSFESHFAHYAPGNFYKKHKDAFKGEANRVLSLIVYLNPSWQPEDGGELLIHTDLTTQPEIKVTPGFGTVVLFLSEEFPHEVLRTNRDRYSIAGWFRVNSSCTERVDPAL